MNENFKKNFIETLYYEPIFTNKNKVIIGFSTKQKETSNNFNLALLNNSNKKLIVENRKVFFSQFKIDYKKIICGEQVHSDKTEIVDKNNVGAGAINNDNIIKGVDALITNTRNVAITVKSADCIPIILYDVNYNIISVIHSGWKSTQKNILQKTINIINKKFNIKEKYLNLIIGPGICSKHYEVDETVIKQFQKEYKNYNEFVVVKNNNKYELDLKKCIKLVAIESGILNNNIHDINICTYENENFFSYRRDGMIGCFFSFAMLL